MLFRSLPESVRTFCLLYQLGNESESAAEYYDMTTSDGNGDWNLDAVEPQGIGARNAGVGSMVQACVMLILTKVRCFKCQKFGHISAKLPGAAGKG